MRPHPNAPQTDRKDIENLIFSQTDAPCLLGGGRDRYAAEAMLAFLMQLYAFVLSKFSEEVEKRGPDICADISYATFGGSDILKDHLMSSGPYWVVKYKTNFHARPNALKLRPRPVNYEGAGPGHWVILWPGATRDRLFHASGRVAPKAQRMAHPAHTGRVRATSRMDRSVSIRDYSPAQMGSGTALPAAYSPIRLIPP